MKLVIAAIVVVLPFAIAYADHRHPAPPKEAFDACASARQGDACTVVLRDHRVEGVCAPFPDTSALVCHPNHPPGPPPQAIDACRTANPGDACSFDGVAGTCARGPDGNGPLACKPGA